MAIQLGPRTRRVLRILGFVLLGLVTFVFALQLTFPYHRVKDKIIEALSAKYQVTISDVERGIIPGRMYFKNVRLESRPEKAGDDVNSFFIKELEVDLGILALIKGTASVDIDASIGDGHLRGNISISKTLTSIDLEGVDLPSKSLPIKEGIGLPLDGKIAFKFALDLPNEKGKSGGKLVPNWQKAEGAIVFECPGGCTIGDGKTKLKPKLKNARSQAFANDGIEFGKVNVESMLVKVAIKGGKMTLTDFDTKSKDGELKVDFEATLAPSFTDSMVAGCLRFKGSEELSKREPKTHAAISTTGANLGPDGLFHIRLDGKFKDMKRLAQNCGPALKNVNMDDPGGTSGDSRPNLTVQPPDESLKAGTPPITPPPAITPPIDAPPEPTPSPTPAQPTDKQPMEKQPTDKQLGPDGAPLQGTPAGSGSGPVGEPVGSGSAVVDDRPSH
ncbi:MAG: type II secretion system protein GspN [Deltaproteobacteria bacterium]|nr:type II secretion system protein GspN [Deltaproteobacteria bacterium]